MNDVKRVHILSLVEAPSAALKSFLERFELKVDFTLVPYEEYQIAFVDSVEKGIEVKNKIPNTAIIVLGDELFYEKALASGLAGIVPLDHVERGYLPHLLSSLTHLHDEQVTAGESFVLSGHLGAGHYGDQLAHLAFKNGFNHLAIRNLFISFSDYLAYMRESEFVAYPIEISYQVSSFFEMEITVPAHKFYVDLIIESLKPKNHDSPYYYLFGESLALTHLCEVFWKKRYEQLTFRFIWWKERGIKTGFVVREVESYKRLSLPKFKIESKAIDETVIGSVPLPGEHPKLVASLKKVSSHRMKLFKDELIKIPGGTEKIDDALVWVRGHPENPLSKLTDEEFRSLAQALGADSELKNIEESFEEEKKIVESSEEKKKRLLSEIKFEAQRRAKAFYDTNVLNQEIIRIKGHVDETNNNELVVVGGGAVKSDDKPQLSYQAFEEKFMAQVETAVGAVERGEKSVSSIFDSLSDIEIGDVSLPSNDLGSLAEQILNASMANVIEEEPINTPATVIAPVETITEALPSAPLPLVENHQIGEQLNFLTQSIQEKNSALKKYKKITDAMKKEIAALKENEERMIREKMDLLGSVQETDTNSTEREIIIGLQGDVNAARREISRKDSTIERLKRFARDAVNQKVKEMESLKRRNHELISLEGNERGVIDRLKRDNETLRHEYQLAQTALERSKEKVSKLTIALKKNEEATTQSIGKNGPSTDLFARAEIDRLSAENRALLLKIAEQERMINRTPEPTVEKPEEPLFSDSKVLETKYKLLEGRVESLQEENDRLKKRINATKDKGPEEVGGMAGKQLDAMKAQVEEMNHQMSDKKKEIVKLKGENTTMKNKIAELERKLAKYGRKAS